MDFRPIDPIQPLFRGDTAGGVGTAGDSREQGSLFADIFQAAVVEDLAAALHRFGLCHVDVEPLVHHSRMHERELQLIGDDRIPAPIEKFHLSYGKIAYAEGLYLSRTV